ncbi:MAG: hypothetical protein KAU16_03525 [Methanophagales archaeon]|nr:hypothetical protein [Methanophagales archaeon]
MIVKWKLQSANWKKGFHKNAPLSTFKIINRVGGREIILALFTVVPKVSPVLKIDLTEIKFLNIYLIDL